MSIDQNSSDDEPTYPYGAVVRPRFHLRSLPVHLRWEVTRRHPYYQIQWQFAREFHRQEPERDPGDSLFRQAALLWLQAIGVSGEPPDPALSFAELGEDQLRTGWLSGAVHPISFRGLAGILLACLPQDTLSDLSDLFHVAASLDSPDDLPGRVASLSELARTHDIALDAFPDEPYVSINPAASERLIAEALHKLLLDWKARYGLKEQRDRSDKVNEYLEVWDLREGWSGGSYDRTQERTFKSVAATLKRPLPTVSNHYRAAFELITGHSYSPELWLRLFALLKLSRLALNLPGIISRRRPLANRARRNATAETHLRGSGTPLSSTVAAQIVAEAEFQELIDDIRTLIDKQLSDADIVAQLELGSESLDVVAYIRTRHDPKA